MSTPLSFKVTLLGSLSPTIPTQSYIIESSTLNIQFEEFQVLPLGFGADLKSSVSAYTLAAGVQLPDKLDSVGSGLTSISSLGWVNLQESTSQI